MPSSAPEAASIHRASARKAAPGKRLASGVATQQRTKIRISDRFEARGWLLPAGVVVLLASAVALWSFWPSGDAGRSVQDLTATARSNAEGADSGGNVLSATFPAQTADQPMTADEVENALTQADNYLATGTEPESAGRHLLYPEEDNALFLYRRVLATQPENLRARKGLAAMVSFYRRYSNSACEKQQWGNCAVIAGLGLRVDPSDEVLVRINAAAQAGQRGEQPALPSLPSE